MMRTINIVFENDDFDQLLANKNELGLTWEAYVARLADPKVHAILKRRSDEKK